MAFRALMLNEQDRTVTAELAEIDDGQLPDGNVTVAVEYSTLNYKDGMILGGIGRLVRNFPHVPGIDFAGVVESSEDARFAAGGVGSVAVHLLSAAGYQVAASTGRPQTAD
ncbi:alcohol dehydrogenase catalytic domain-containing protein [Candidatus Poriferisodalis sp.]|uniref:alcohol dehydrogenase catalytic domain-containing protein n=1 Tax=Candidatus Poriferisodalis sp. TaxID=3101277 RepID=UPI003C7058A6